MAIHSNDDNPSSDSFTNGPYGTETITTTATAKNLWRIHGEAEYEAAPGTYDLPHLFNTKQAQSGRNTLTKAPCFSMGRATKFYDYQREKEQELRSSLSPPGERSNIEDPLNQSVYDFRQPRSIQMSPANRNVSTSYLKRSKPLGSYLGDVRKLGRLRTFEPVARQLNDSSHSPESTSVERQMRSSGSTDTRSESKSTLEKPRDINLSEVLNSSLHVCLVFRGNLGWQSKNGRAVAKDLDE
eukprot:CAMPEP_0115047316 /NCGR_PEP_ID=MMETSP0216-20121206/49236_1 /TAXON_ID=223996 /ORGANISM="Protocruzia adherens, Strain Boccale" /LENGTH=240 /DNA_ID=CAMNT_0002430493 /DNA_START=656 /DNA_END=1375 /DNA_ORIENTATION=-